MCVGGHEQFCVEFPTLTYGGVDRRDGQPTHGAYSTEYVVTEGFVYHLPEGLDPAGVAPLMCAGVTVWEPLEQWGIGPGMAVGVVGLGGLGHLAVKFAVALGAEVDLFTTSPSKADAARRLGVRQVVVSTDEEQMTEARGRYDFIIDTVAVAHDVSGYTMALKFGGTLCLVGALDPTSINPLAMLGRNLTVAGGGGGRRPGECSSSAADTASPPTSRWCPPRLSETPSIDWHAMTSSSASAWTWPDCADDCQLVRITATLRSELRG